MVGTEVGHYRILSRIGVGGMGEVYLADDPALGRKVALKFLPAGHPEERSARGRLLHEARAAARLDHPFICKIYETGDADGRPFLAMEYVEGQTLADRLAAGSLPLKDIVRLGLEIAEALDFAHQRGIVHRDLKPANVMLTVDGHAKVMDFGVAKDTIGTTGATTITASPTLAGQTVGTMSYMSPEQLCGAPVDARSDVFAFGVLMYLMATGRHPFKRSSAVSTANAIIHETAAPIEDSRRDAPVLLSHIVSRCLEKERDRRYQSLRDVAIELSTLADGSVSRSPQRANVRARWIRRWVWPSVACVFVVAAVGALWQWPDVFSRPALAFKERDWIVISDVENTTGEPVFDRSLNVALEVGVAQSRFVNVLPLQRVQAALQRMKRKPGEPLDEALASEVAVREGVKGVVSCSIGRFGNVYSLAARLVDPQSRAAVLTESVRANDRDQVLAALDELATRIRRRLGESLSSISQQGVPLPKATTASLEALKLYADSMNLAGKDVTASEALLRQALAMDPDFALAHAELGRRLYLMSDRQPRLEAEEHVTRALALLDRLTPRERLWIQATADDSRGLRARAVDEYRTYLLQYPDDGRAWFRMGWTYMATLRQYDRAVEAFNRTITLNPSNPNAYINLATSYLGLRNFDLAVDTYRKAFALEPSLLLEQYVNHEYGFTLVHAGQLDAAADVFRKMLASAGAIDQARGHRSMALLQMYRGRYGDGIDELRQSIVLNRANHNMLSEYRDHLILVRALDAKGQSAAADAELTEAKRLRRALSLGPEWLQSLIKIEARRGQVAEARVLVSQLAGIVGKATLDSSTNRSVDLDQSHLDHARGELALAERRGEAAIQLLETANVGPMDPDILESLAAALAAGGQLEAAAKRYEQLLAAPDFGYEWQEDWFRAHVVLGAIYERLGRHEDARRLYERLITVWKDGDADLVTLKEAQQRLTRLGR